MLASANITEQQWRVLRGLSEHGEVEAGKLAYIACILPQSLSRITRNFEKKHLIFMKNDPSDARKILLSLTDKGKILMSRATIDSKEIYSQLIEDFGRENLEQLLEKLNLLQSSLNLKSR
jgi:homoprotocatechuate degradation regulator HpaR